MAKCRQIALYSAGLSSWLCQAPRIQVRNITIYYLLVAGYPWIIVRYYIWCSPAGLKGRIRWKNRISCRLSLAPTKRGKGSLGTRLRSALFPFRASRPMAPTVLAATVSPVAPDGTLSLDKVPCVRAGTTFCVNAISGSCSSFRISPQTLRHICKRMRGSSL
jgi:hypothetical protein